VELSPTDNHLGNVSTALLSDDPITQHDVFTAMNQIRVDEEELKFLDAPRRAITLKELRTMYERKASRRALQLLMSRHRLVIDDEYIAAGDSDKVAWKAQDTGALDFLACVPNKPGFSAVLPNPPSGTMYEWQVDFTCPQKEFKAKHAHLGFDPARSMLYIGRCNGEDLWGAWIPKEFFDEPDYNRPATGFSSGDTRLSTDMYCWTIIWMALLFEVYGVSDVTLDEVYPKDLDSLDAVRTYTNLM
jgi:hypothetical protein